MTPGNDQPFYWRDYRLYDKVTDRRVGYVYRYACGDDWCGQLDAPPYASTAIYGNPQAAKDALWTLAEKRADADRPSPAVPPTVAPTHWLRRLAASIFTRRPLTKAEEKRKWERMP